MDLFANLRVQKYVCKKDEWTAWFYQGSLIFYQPWVNIKNSFVLYSRSLVFCWGNKLCSENFIFILLLWHLNIPKHLEVKGEWIDFMVSHGMITTIQRLAHLKKGPCHNLSSRRHRGSVLQIHQGGRGRYRALFRNTNPLSSHSHFGIPLWRFLPPRARYRTINEVPPDISKVSGCAEW